MKRQVCLYLEIEIIQALKQNRINISEFINNILLNDGNTNKALMSEIKRLTEALETARREKRKKGVTIYG